MDHGDSTGLSHGDGSRRLPVSRRDDHGDYLSRGEMIGRRDSTGWRQPAAPESHCRRPRRHCGPSPARVRVVADLLGSRRICGTDAPGPRAGGIPRRRLPSRGRLVRMMKDTGLEKLYNCSSPAVELLGPAGGPGPAGSAGVAFDADSRLSRAALVLQTMGLARLF